MDNDSKHRFLPFSNGEEEDHEWFESMSERRLSELSKKDVLSKIDEYLKQMILVLEKDLERFTTDQVEYRDTRKRILWCEGMVIWISHNL